MLGDVRQRRPASMEKTVKSGMSRLETVFSDSMLRLNILPSRVKLAVLVSAVLSLFFYLYLVHWVFASDSEKTLEAFLQTEKCPTCFGGSGCGRFYYRDLQFSGSSKYRMLDFTNSKNVHYATGRDGRMVVVKKMATDSELAALDKRLCLDAMRPEGCDIARVIVRSNIAKDLIHEPLTPSKLRETGGFMFKCPSFRLLDRLWDHFKEFKKKKEIFTSDKVHVLYMGLLNPEPLILQTFPRSEGWPFPEYLGACGRVVIEEFAGKELSQFYHSPFPVRAGIAHQLLQIAHNLTTKSDFVLYLTDVNYENFAVDAEGRVTVVDTENVIVMDKLALEARKPSQYGEPLEARFSDCQGENCLTFVPSDLCSHLHSDHNIYAMCRNLLSHYANEPGMPGGLLHDMPESARDYWDLYNLLEECVRPTQKMGRWKVKDKLMQALEALKDQRKDHLLTKQNQ